MIALLLSMVDPLDNTRESFAGVVFHTKVPHKRKGHIKGAVNAFWKNNFNEDGTFKNITELRRYYQGKGITEDKIIVTYCNEGLHATPAWFVLTQLLGYKNSPCL